MNDGVNDVIIHRYRNETSIAVVWRRLLIGMLLASDKRQLQVLLSRGRRESIRCRFYNYTASLGTRYCIVSVSFE